MGRIFNHIGIPAIALISCCSPLEAGEFAVLANGYKLHADRHEVDGTSVRLYENGGMTSVALTEIASFELEVVAAPAAQAAVSTSQNVSAPAIAPVPATDLYAETAKKHGLPPALVRSVVKAESNFRADAVSPKGAIGLMQLMPGTAKLLGADPADPAQNVDAGTRYLRELLARYEKDDDQVARAVAAYNAGPGAVDRYHGVPPYRETRDYVRRVLTNYGKAKDAN